jgi:hypothetical protein
VRAQRVSPFGRPLYVFDLLGVHDGMMSPWVASRISRTAHFLAGRYGIGCGRGSLSATQVLGLRCYPHERSKIPSSSALTTA